LTLPELALLFRWVHAPPSLKIILEENSNFYPGIRLFPRGYIVFANDNGGDAYCFDIKHLTDGNEPSVVWLPHDEHYEVMSDESLFEFSEKVARNLEEFWLQLLNMAMEWENSERE